MLQMNTLRLGEEIKRLRKLHQISQKDLAEGICTQPAISTIEKGKVYPSIDVLYLISIKLSVTVDHFLDILLQERNDHIECTFNTIEEYLKQKDYEEIYLLCKFEKSRNNAELGIHYEQYINWNFLIASYYTKRMTWISCIDSLKSIIENNSILLIGFDFQDIKIMNSIAIIYAENKQYNNALDMFDKISKKSIINKNYNKFNLKIMYNSSKVYFLLKNYEASLSVINKAMKLSLELEDMSIMGQLYYHQGICYEKLNYSEEETKESFQHSKFFFKLLNRQAYVQLLDSKSKYFT